VAVFLQPRSTFARMLSWAPLVRVGGVSYGVYLFHDPIWRVVARFMNLRDGANGTVTQELAALIVVWTLSVGVAWLHYRYVEARFLALRGPRNAKPARAAEPVSVRSGGAASAGISSVAENPVPIAAASESL